VKICPTCSASYGNDIGFCPHDGAALRSSTTLQPGAVIRKKYEILNEIGRGGMGVVYRARHLVWNEEKALKVLVAAGSEALPGLKGLMAEALVMRKLHHPHIVRVEDVDYTEGDQLFVVMEYVAGQSLRQRMDAGVLAEEAALTIAAQTCSALSAAHQKGIIHRDIKPQNLLLATNADGTESVRVIDFGIAKAREEAGLGFTVTVTGTTGIFVGTPQYASPEQALGVRGSDLDGRTDLYSLGLVLYEMLTGRLPFAGDTPVAVLVQRIQVPPAPLDRSRPDLHFSPEVSKLVMTALEKERENRYQSAEEMERAIAAVVASRPLREGRALPDHGAIQHGAGSLADSFFAEPVTGMSPPPVRRAAARAQATAAKPPFWTRSRLAVAGGGVVLACLLAAWLFARAGSHQGTGIQKAPPPPAKSTAVPAPLAATAPPVAGPPRKEPPPQPEKISVPAGTPISIRTGEAIDPNATLGWQFQAALAAPVPMAGRPAFHQGAAAVLQLDERPAADHPTKRERYLKLVSIAAGDHPIPVTGSGPALKKGNLIHKNEVAAGTQFEFTLAKALRVTPVP
jgi:eukaryotic-like serine/threonine-protein kinase